jgi:hypothetical protein
MNTRSEPTICSLHINMGAYGGAPETSMSIEQLPLAHWKLDKEAGDDAVQFLLREEVIVPAEENGYVVIDHQLVNRFFPFLSALIKTPGAITVVASRSIEGNPFNSASSLWISAYELMAEDELEDGVAV